MSIEGPEYLRHTAAYMVNKHSKFVIHTVAQTKQGRRKSQRRGTATFMAMNFVRRLEGKPKLSQSNRAVDEGL